MLASQIDEALAALEAIERQLDGLSPTIATRYRAASHLVRSAVLAFQDDSLALLAIVISEVFVERSAGLGALLTEAYGRTEAFKSASVPGSVDGSRQPGIDGDAITARERDVLSMIGQGYSNKRIARSLEISPETVKSHVKHIFSKLDVTTRSEAVSRAGWAAVARVSPVGTPRRPLFGIAPRRECPILGARRFGTEGASWMATATAAAIAGGGDISQQGAQAPAEQRLLPARRRLTDEELIVRKVRTYGTGPADHQRAGPTCISLRAPALI
jgi:DNA-binding CsgD family transcriptional regulator